jgi:hypothetical protein
MHSTLCKSIFGRIVEKDPGSRQVTSLQFSILQGHLQTFDTILDKVVDKNSKKKKM